MTGKPLPPATDVVLATVLREAVTNVLRHGTATQCIISATADDGVVRLRVSNDGATTPATGTTAGTAPGNGLANITARIHAVGGHLTSRHADDRFDLIAEIPLPATAP